MYICNSICVSIYTHVYICLPSFLLYYMYLFIVLSVYLSTHTHVYLSTHTCIYVYLKFYCTICIYSWFYLSIYLHTHMCMYIYTVSESRTNRTSVLPPSHPFPPKPIAPLSSLHHTPSPPNPSLSPPLCVQGGMPMKPSVGGVQVCMYVYMNIYVYSICV